MLENGWERIRKRLIELRRESEDAPLQSQPYAIRLLRRMLRGTQDRRAQATIMTMLATECSWYGLSDEEERIIVEMTRMFPDEPLPWISWAGIYIVERPDLEKARAICEIAIEKAKVAGRFVRHAYTTRARIASKLRDYHLLERTLEILSDYRPPHGGEDVAYEQDFLFGLPADAVDAVILQRYKDAIALDSGSE